jgi:hypothetical protein
MVINMSENYGFNGNISSWASIEDNVQRALAWIGENDR